MLYLTSKRLSPEDTKHPEFRALSAMLIEDFTQILDERLVIHADVFMPPYEDEASWTDFRNLALTQMTSFLLQRPVTEDEVIDSRFLTYDHAREFYKNSPTGENGRADELQQLRSENIRLKEENEDLKIQLMRYRPRRHRGCPETHDLRFGAIAGSVSYV